MTTLLKHQISKHQERTPLLVNWKFLKTNQAMFLDHSLCSRIGSYLYWYESV